MEMRVKQPWFQRTERENMWLKTQILVVGFIASILALGLVRSGYGHSHSVAAGEVVSQGNPGVIELNPTSFEHIYAISDVHGMFDSLVPLLRSAQIIDANNQWAAGRSLLIVIGDSIDKGPKSIEVLDLWISLMSQAVVAGGQLVHLLGNHEAEFLADPQNKKAKALLIELQAKHLSTDALLDPTQPRGNFIRQMRIAARVGFWLFCHSGYLPEQFDQFSSDAAVAFKVPDFSSSFFIGDDSILEAKDWWRTDMPTRQEVERRLQESGLYGVVFGHMPGALNVEGSDAISKDRRLIKIDNGMAPQSGAHPGSVLVFDNPSDLTKNAPPTVQMIRSGHSVAGQLPEEISGAPTFDAGD